MLVIALLAALYQGAGIVTLRVTAAGVPVAAAQVLVNGVATMTDVEGVARLQLPSGQTQVTVAKDGFLSVTLSVSVADGQDQSLAVELDALPTLEEYVTVSATRTDARVEDQAMRVEVIGLEEIEEKQSMTPGDIVMLLNEMGGLRVQATSPSLGAASIRVQGMRGRYTRFLSDGLPLFGDDVGGLGLLQIPPADLGQVEVIKGVASALYGAGALGGVVDLISKRPGPEARRDLLINRTSLGGTDVVLFAEQPLSTRWRGTLLVGGHLQERHDSDADGWADLAGYERAVVRPRLFWDNQTGRSFFATGGVTVEERRGGTMPGAVLLATAAPFPESLNTVRVDGGFVSRVLIADRYVVTARASATRQEHDRRSGDVLERDRHDTLFAELAVRGSHGMHTWVAGAAFDRATFTPQDLPEFAYAYNTPGLFVQDEVAVARWIGLSASARFDRHNVFGAFVSPRVSALVRRGPWISRVSAGGGFFAPTPLTEETEAAGLSRLRIDGPLTVEHGRSLSWDLTRTIGPFRVTGTAFRYQVRNPALVDRDTFTLATVPEATTTAGIEAVATFRRAPLSVTGTYTYVSSLEGAGAAREAIALTPRHSAGIDAMWEREGRWRVGVESYFTGEQRLEDNPYRHHSASYVLFGSLAERRMGRWRLFVNVENLGNVRQTDWEPLVRPTRAVDGRWTVDAWAPLDGRVFNGGVRLSF